MPSPAAEENWIQQDRGKSPTQTSTVFIVLLNVWIERPCCAESRRMKTVSYLPPCQATRECTLRPDRHAVDMERARETNTHAYLLAASTTIYPPRCFAAGGSNKTVSRSMKGSTPVQDIVPPANTTIEQHHEIAACERGPSVCQSLNRMPHMPHAVCQ